MEHSKTIGAIKLTKNDMDHENPNFRVLLAYGTRKNSLGYRNMEGKALYGNLAISDPAAKMVLRSGIRFGRYIGATLHRRDPRSDDQNSNLFTLKTRHKVG